MLIEGDASSVQIIAICKNKDGFNQAPKPCDGRKKAKREDGHKQLSNAFTSIAKVEIMNA